MQPVLASGPMWQRIVSRTRTPPLLIWTLHTSWNVRLSSLVAGIKWISLCQKYRHQSDNEVLHATVRHCGTICYLLCLTVHVACH